MHITILGKRYNLRFVKGLKDNVGECDGPERPYKEIRILNTLKNDDLTNAVIHEMLHAGLWHLDEEIVDPLATDMAKVLWKLGYRRLNKEQIKELGL